MIWNANETREHVRHILFAFNQRHEAGKPAGDICALYRMTSLPTEWCRNDFLEKFERTD